MFESVPEIWRSDVLLSNRYSNLIIAIVGLACSSPCKAKEDKVDQLQNDKALYTQIERVASAVEKLQSSQAPDRGCQPGQDKHGSDLCAQWKAADAASDSAIWAMVSTIVAIVGTVGILFTLKETRRTAKAAVDAVNQNKAANKIAEQHQRAHVVPKIELAPWPLEEGFDVAVRAENIGGSAAINARIRLVHLAEAPSDPPINEVEGPRHVIKVGETVGLSLIQHGEGFAIGSVIAGVVTYDTIFGGPHQSFFCWQFQDSEKHPLIPARGRWTAVAIIPTTWPHDT